MSRPGEHVTVRVPVILAGTDLGGRAFQEKTLATVIAHNEATILSSHSLALGQALEIQCIGTSRGAAARVLAQLSVSPQGYIYEVDIRSEDTNLWEIGFPSAAEPEVAAGRILLECKVCRAQEVALLSASELEIFQMNQAILRPCPQCSEVRAWVKPSLEKLLASAKERKPAAVAIPEPPPRARAQNERSEPRARIKVPACVKTSEFGEERVVTENVSEGGLGFTAHRTYKPGECVEIAVPYVEGGANVFVKARIQWARDLPSLGLAAHGAAYVHASRRAKRVTPRKPLPLAFIGAGQHAKASGVVISMVGVLVVCAEEIGLATHVRMGIETPQGLIRMGAVAKRRVPQVGMAFEFTTMGPNDRMALKRLILNLAKQLLQPSSEGSGPPPSARPD